MEQSSRVPDLLTTARFIVDRVALGILAIDREQRIVFFSREAGRICGVDHVSVIGRQVAEVFPDFPAEAQLAQRALIDGRCVRNLRQEIVYHGSTWHLLASAGPIHDEAGETVGALVLFSDITNLVALERRARDAERLASVGEMTVGTVHEIRNPLAAIRGFVQMFAERFDALGQPADGQLARTALAEIDRSARLLTELLQYSRPTADGWRAVRLESVLADTVQLLSRGRSGAPGTMLDLAPLPEVFANPDRIRQVITNLWQNAADATGAEGHITVSARSLCDAVAVEISDDGPGLTPQMSGHLFEPFYTTKATGTGLGLVICKRIIEDHGGALTIRNLPGGGAAARFTLPLPAVPER